MSLKRLARELADIKKDASLTHICTAEPADNADLFVWHATLKGQGDVCV
jgi:ubiquitin-protein ligase